jgi:hypothetical protein
MSGVHYITTDRATSTFDATSNQNSRTTSTPLVLGARPAQKYKTQNTDQRNTHNTDLIIPRIGSLQRLHLAHDPPDLLLG